MSALLRIEDLSIALPPGADRPLALDRVALELAAGETLCVVGESGSGKSALANSVLGLLPDALRPVGGRILFEGQDLLAIQPAALRQVRGARIGMIFQEPMTALNPVQTIGAQIGEMFAIHTRLGRSEIRARVLALLEQVKIPKPVEAARAYPHALSGGQRQRAMIAMALALEPSLLIADEPTTALDVTIQAEILKLIRELQQRNGMAVFFVTHDFGVVAQIADRVTVMRAGHVVETGTRRDVLRAPRAAYTRQLMAAVPSLQPPVRRVASGEALLRLEGLSKTYRSGGLFTPTRITAAVRDISLTLPRGGVLGIVGESGSGKSTLARCIVRLLDPDAGHILLDGLDLAPLGGRALRDQRHRLQMVFQDPFASLDPRQSVGAIVAEGPMLRGLAYRDAWRRAETLFELVGLDPAGLARLPHEFSGGQRQRIALARALALEPQVLVADEPVSALDVSVQAQVLRLLADLRDRLGLSMIFITHDLRVAAQICDQIAVMRDGRMVEIGAVADVFDNPKHDYTKTLLASVPGRAFFAAMR